MSPAEDRFAPLFLGPAGEGIGSLAQLVARVLEIHGQRRLETYPSDPRPGGPPAGAPAEHLAALDRLLDRLGRTYPYFHPRYAAQMIKDPAVPAVAAYFAAMLWNPNNHAYEGGPATTEMEMEVVDDLLLMAGFEDRGRAAGWGHLCSGGSLANLEALWVVRETRPDAPVVVSRTAHYSWKRNAAILRMPRVLEVEVDGAQRMDADHLATLVARERPAMVVASIGTTGMGAVDPLDSILALRDRHGFHLHVDAAYGGYARACVISPAGGLLPFDAARRGNGMDDYVYRQLVALSGADSVTIDPHKHGLAPYGAGCVLYRDLALKRPLANAAPYTYHLEDRPNLGRVTLEGSRPGAAAAACWLVHQLVRRDAEGFGALVGAGMSVARDLASRFASSPRTRPLHAPDLDILCLARIDAGPRDGLPLSAIDEATDRVYRRLSVTAAAAPPVMLSRYTIPSDLATRALPFARPDTASLSALRLVLMKHWLASPERAPLLDSIVEAIDAPS